MILLVYFYLEKIVIKVHAKNVVQQAKNKIIDTTDMLCIDRFLASVCGGKYMCLGRLSMFIKKQKTNKKQKGAD